MVRFQKALAGQSAPSKYEEQKLPDTTRIRNSHDLKRAFAPTIHGPISLQVYDRDDGSLHGNAHVADQRWPHRSRSRNPPSGNATMVHSTEEPTASKPATVQEIVWSPNA
jgi:hypothetical protein